MSGFPRGSVGKESACNAGDAGRCAFDPLAGTILWRRAWQPTPVSLPGESHGQRSLMGYSSWGCKESDKAERTEQPCTHAHAVCQTIFQALGFDPLWV